MNVTVFHCVQAETWEHEGRMLDWGVVRRSLLFALALSMAGLGPVPLSACAIFTSKMAECATPQTKSRCNQMNMDESIPKVAAAPNASCCSLSNAPLSATRQKMSELSLAAFPIVVLGSEWKLLRTKEQRPTQIEQALSPPPLQSVLCTFLI